VTTHKIHSISTHTAKHRLIKSKRQTKQNVLQGIGAA